ncbi:MAG: 4-hydroxybenzoate 3-monooxygenase [Hyphomonadaceae bacterium]|nr:4-hydroxybenzoate 3-monooxygenase [Hyphomonadaceae bacterium]
MTASNLPSRTRIAIIGAGPAGMMLGHLLRQEGVDCLVLERRDRAYVEGRVRAGVIEQTTVEIMQRVGLAGRLLREGLPHGGFSISWNGELIHIDVAGLTGKHITVYGQQEIMHDLFDAAPARGLDVVFGAEDVTLHDIEGDRPFVTWRSGGETRRIDCEFIAGCDGFHGVSRASIPSGRLVDYEKIYPFGWLGVLADVPPCAPEVVYASHERGFALASMRSATRSRYYVQVGAEDRLEDWPDDRFWSELAIRLGETIAAGLERAPAIETAMAPLRSYVCEPMRFGRLLLAGDAAHIVPPTGAKGLNLAASDALFLSEALTDYCRTGSMAGVDGYSGRALSRVWKAERFSWWFTHLTHRFPTATPIERKLQIAEMAYLSRSRAAQTALAENYAGLPLSP